MQLRLILVGAFLCLTVACAGNPANLFTAEGTFQQWITAFNANDVAALTTFYRDKTGDADRATWALDNREESGGLELVKIEVSDPLNYVVLLRERQTAGMQRVSVRLSATDAVKLKDFEQLQLPLPKEQALKEMDAFAKRLVGKDKFSGVIVVKQRDKVLYEQSFGFADRESKRPVTIDTPFFIASAGKMFTGVTVLQLIEAGKVRFDDPIGKYLVDYPNRDVATKVTVRHLLTHRGGTGDIGILLPEESANRARVRTIADAIKLNGARPPAFEPGSREEYSNYGFILLGALIEKVSGESYYDYVSKHVLMPAGMTSTAWPTRDHLEGIAKGYTTSDKTPLHEMTGILPRRPLSAGGCVSTVSDLLRFAEALKAGKLISKPMLAEAISQQTPWYGYGFIVSPPPEFPHWGHGGGAPGQSVVFANYPTNDMTMVCLSNRDPPVCDRLMTSLHYHLAPGLP